jgi:hypothetical protein
VEIAYGTATTNYDVDKTSGTTVSAIAWYSDAVYKAEPIVSGYRLVLSYEIIHVLPTPIPTLPSMLDNLTKLRHLLRHWASEDSSHQMPRMLTFILKSIYREDESGVGILTRNDGRKLHPITDLLGFKLFFAVLDCHLVGDADERDDHLHGLSGPTRWSRPYLGSHKLPTMTVLRSKSLKAKDFVDLDGDSYADMTGWPLNVSDLVLQAPLQEYVPDVVEYGGLIYDVSSLESDAYVSRLPEYFDLFRDQAPSSFVSYCVGKIA